MTEQKSDDALLTECQQLLKTIDNLESVYASTNAESDAARLVRLLLERVQQSECPSCAELRARITQLEQGAKVVAAARDRINLHENDIPNQQCIMRLSINELGHLNELLGLLGVSSPEPQEDR